MTAATVLWLGAVAGGFAALQRYGAIAGTAHTPTAGSADFLAHHRRPGRALLVMAVHPNCPCSSASLAELGDLLARSRGRCDALLLEYEPRQLPADWPRAPRARELGGVSVPVLRDAAGQLAAALGAETSGHAVFVDAAGTVRFHGGLTLSRGHRGRTPAQDAILATLAGQSATLAEAPVYGCALVPTCSPASGS